jgi:signal transduction histidine kinase
VKIRTKMALLVTGLTAAVTGALCANLLRLEKARGEEEVLQTTDAVMQGVQRIAQESLESRDDLMLPAYLKYLMKEHPEIELVVIESNERNAKMGQARSELFFRSARAERASTGERVSIQLGFSKNHLDRHVRRAQSALAARIGQIAAPALILGLLGALWLSRLISTPLTELEVAARQVGAGKLMTRVVGSRQDELGELCRQFNDMTSSLRETSRLKEDLLSTLTHELNNPLTGLKGFLSYLETSMESLSETERLESYRTMQDVVSQMELSLKNALELFRAGARPTLRRQAVDPWELVEEVVRLFAALANSNSVALQASGPSAAVVLDADRELLRRVVINLVSNALKYTPQGGNVKIDLSEDSENVLLTVSDDGPGIPASDLELIFTKFYRSSGEDGLPQRIPGSGLGLAIAKQAVESHRGRIWVESQLSRGSTFHVSLPKSGGTDAS